MKIGKLYRYIGRRKIEIGNVIDRTPTEHHKNRTDNSFYILSYSYCIYYMY